jgi:hypothetical protein
MQQRGTKTDVVVYADPKVYASFPGIVRAEDKVVLVFQVQDLDALKAIPEHPHWQKVARPAWAVSADQGRSWAISPAPPRVGKILDATNPMAPLADGGAVTLSFHQDRPKYALIQRGFVAGYRPYLDLNIPGIEKHSFNDFGPFDNFHAFGLVRTPDGIVAGGYARVPREEGAERTTALFLKSTDEGKTWKYLSYIPNPHPFGFSEPDLLAGPGNYLQVFLRVDWCYVPKEQWPSDAGAGEEVYGYYLYRAESQDGGRTWSEPVQLPLWGHPPCVKRLASGNVLLVFGHRRPPYGIRACLSRDNGKTWDLKTLKTVYTFDPGSYDLGYPVATQFPDGSILCAWYGYSTPDISGKEPHGIFAGVFDEDWLTA